MREQEQNPFAAPGQGRPGVVGSDYVSQGPLPGVGAYAAPAPPANVSAIILLVISTIAVIPTFLLATPPFVMAIVALSRNRDAPDSSRRIALIGWAILAIAVVIAAAVWWWVFEQLGATGVADPFQI